MDWKSVLSTVAPTVVSALGSPLAGAAVAAIGSIFGMSDANQTKIKDFIEKGQLTSEQISSLKELELKLQNEEKERGFKYAELEFKDRDSARQREVGASDKVNRNLAYALVSSFIIIIGCTLAGIFQVETVLAGTLIGYLSAKCEQVLAYYFGSTSGSARKTELLAIAEPVKSR